jgi:tRNA (adenine37-N6)-methyltransferase
MIHIKQIGTIHSTRKEAVDDLWLKEECYIELSNDFPLDSLSGITDFSHVEVLFHMNQVDPNKIETSARHPRNNSDWPKVGIFAQRGKNRPNQIGLSVCDVIKHEGKKLFVRGLDAIDGTPVLDIKPWLKEFAPRGAVRQPEWSAELMKEYWEASIVSKEPTMFDPVVIDTEHVKIRPLSTVTWQKLSDALLYEGSFHATNWGIKSPDDIKRLYEKCLATLQEKLGNPIVFLSKDESVVLGMTNFMNVEPANKMIEIGGTWINKKYQRTFVNTETKFALLEYAFETLKLNRVEFRIDAENVTSQKAVQRLGIHFDGLMPRRKINANGHVRDYAFYSVTDITWPQVKSKIKQLEEKY